MSKEWTKWLQQILLGLVILSLAACDKISIPRFTWDQKPATKVPINVRYQFDPRLSQLTQTVDACGLPYTIDSGEIITQTFLKVGNERFASVDEQPNPPTDGTIPTSSNTLTVDLQFVQSNFEPIGRSGEEDRFLANVALELQAIYRDSTGQALAKTPLTYSERAKLWTPALTSQSTSCSTGQFDAVVENAAETLALDMVNVIPQLYGEQPTPPSLAATTTLSAGPTAQTIPTRQPSIAFRTMLQDHNDNLALEGGEKLILKIETTNTSSHTLSSAYVELSGTQSIIDAFSKVTTFPIPIGPLQPGEKKTTEVRGRMPKIVAEEKGELIISISLSQGIPPGAHTILAAIQPYQSNTTPASATPTAQPLAQNTTQPPPSHSPYFALVVALDEYRDPWSKAYHISDTQINDLLATLHSTKTFARDHVQLLRGKHATRSDIEEALYRLAKNHLTPDATLFVYFGGHALIDSTSGEVYLTPYEGSVLGSKKTFDLSTESPASSSKTQYQSGLSVHRHTDYPILGTA